MKRKIVSVVVLLLTVLFIFTLVCCGDNSKQKTKTFTVTFASDDGTVINTLDVENGKKIAIPLEPNKEWHTFDGWYLGDNKWNFETDVVKSNITLVAKWIEVDKYPSDLSEYIEVPDYLGDELSLEEVLSVFEEDKQALIDAYSKYSDPIISGTIEQGHNVTISISAYKYDETKTGNRGDAISDISIDKYTILNIHNVDTSKDAEKEDDKTEYFPEMQNMLLGTKFDFTPGTSYNNVRTLIYTYPTDYTVKSLQGVKVIHLVYISSVTATIAPELNDQFFIDKNLGYESYQEYEDYMIHQIKLNLIWNKIVEGTTVKSYPSDRLNECYDEYDNYVHSYMEQSGISTLNELYTRLGITEDEFNQQRSDYAEGIVKEEMILYYIVEKENIEITDTEYDTILAQIAEDAGYDSAKAYLDAYGEALTDRTVLWEKVKIYLLNNATIVE